MSLIAHVLDANWRTWLFSCGWPNSFGWYFRDGWMSVEQLKYICSSKPNPSKGLSFPSRQIAVCTDASSQEPFCRIGHTCGWVCTCDGERGWGLFMGVLFFIREIKDTTIDLEMALEILQWNGTPAHMQYFWKMLNSIYPLLGIVNCAFGSICLTGTCTIVKFLQPNKISENGSLQEEADSCLQLMPLWNQVRSMCLPHWDLHLPALP